MKRLALLLALAGLSTSAAADLKTLQYQFNDNVIISISNVKCPLDELRKDYPLSVVAFRIDGQKLFGCYKGEKDLIQIQWAGGDITSIEANKFLTK